MNFDIAIIGGGPAGYTAAERAGANGLKAVLFEKEAIGGVCLNEGCIPTKTLLYSAKILDSVKAASKYGVSAESPSFDLSKIMSRKNKTVKMLTGGEDDCKLLWCDDCRERGFHRRGEGRADSHLLRW